MDILVMLGIIVAIILMAVGLYMMVRRPDAPARPIEKTTKAPLVAEEISSESTSAVPSEPVISANQFITQTIHQQVVEHPASVAKQSSDADDINTDQPLTTTPAPQDFDDLPILDQEVSQSLEPVDKPEQGGLDAMLDDLEQATLQPTDRIQPTVDAAVDEQLDEPHLDTTLAISPQQSAIETAQLAEWQGESLLIDEHLADHSRSEEDSILVQAEHIIAINLLPKSGRPLEGRKVLEALRKHGLRFGEMSLFHRYEESSGQGALMFSVLKFTKDGPVGFDLDTMVQENFEGLSFFLALPGIRPLQGFDMMISTAQRLSVDFYAQLFDEEMNLFSEQLKSHYRHQVLDFRPSVLN